MPETKPIIAQHIEGRKMARRSAPWLIRPAERRVLLIAGDALVGLLALLAGLYLWGRADSWLEFSWDFLRARSAEWVYAIPVIWILLLVETYDVRKSHRRSETVRGVLLAAVIGLGIYLFLFFLAGKENALPRLVVGWFLLIATLLTLAWRMLFISVFTAPQFMRRVLIIGAGKAGSMLVHLVNDLWPAPFYLVGLIDDDPDKQGTKIDNYPVLGGSQVLLETINRERISDLVFAISGEMNGQMFQALLDAQEQGVEVSSMQVMYEDLLNRVPIFTLEADWILRSFVDQARASTFYEASKRLVDLVGGLLFGLGLLLVTPFVSLAIWLDSGLPIFFTQNRMGRRGEIFRVYKFRTMRQDSEKDGKVRVTQEGDERITRVGLFLRKSHLDELPQVINVLLGDMSLVGPRAERSELVLRLQQMIPFYRARLLVKPGITGWAQVNFGYAATVEETAVKLEYDLYYIKHRSLLLDIVILLRTVGTVIGLRGT